MATALAYTGVLGTESLSYRIGDHLSSKQKAASVSLTSPGITIASRSAAFLCVVAFAGRQGEGQSSCEGTKKKKPYIKRRRGGKSKNNGAAVEEVKSDLRALISNSAVPVFSEGSELPEEPEEPEVLKPLAEDDDGSDDGGPGNPLGRRVLGKAVVSWMKDGIAAMVREVVREQERGETKEVEERMGTGHNLVALAQPFLLARPMPQGLEPLCLRASLHYPTLLDHYQRELRVALKDSQAKGKVENWQVTEAWKLLKKFAKSGVVFLTFKSFRLLKNE